VPGNLASRGAGTTEQKKKGGRGEMKRASIRKEKFMHAMRITSWAGFFEKRGLF